jgi:perosamine synthetase
MNSNPITIPVYQPSIGDIEKQYVDECLSTGWISSRGRFITDFEEAFSKYTEIKHCVAVCNGTVALHLAMLAAGIGPGDEVIVPALTYVAPANAVRYTGAEVSFADCNDDDWQINVSDVRKLINQRTRAIIAVHLYGGACDLTSLRQLCDERGLLLIEDCAEAIGTKFADRHVGQVGDISTFSFYGNKTITTGEGGMVCTSNNALAERVTHLKGQGLARSREYWHDIVGYNYRMTNICAAIGLAQLSRLHIFLERKKEIAKLYKDYLEPFLSFQGNSEHSTHSHWMIAATTRDNINRDDIRNALRNNGIETRPVFYPVNSMPMYTKGFRTTRTADRIGASGINFPSHPSLTDNQIAYISEIAANFIKKQNK